MTNTDIHDPDFDDDPDPDGYRAGPEQRQPRIFIQVPPTLPPEVAAALSKVMASIKRLHRGDKNEFAKYKYTSADDFFEAVGPLMAEAGLLILAQQVAFETRVIPTVDRGERGGSGAARERSLLMINFDFYLAHSSGAIWAMPIRRTINVEAGGPQQWGSAQTFAVKQFLRSLLLIPTGDVDADVEQPFTQTAVKPPPAKPTPPPENRARTQTSAARDTVNSPQSDQSGNGDPVKAFLAALVHKDTIDEVNDLFRDFRNGPGAHLPRDEKERAAKGYNYRLTSLERTKGGAEPSNG